MTSNSAMSTNQIFIESYSSNFLPFYKLSYKIVNIHIMGNMSEFWKLCYWKSSIEEKMFLKLKNNYSKVFRFAWAAFVWWINRSSCLKLSANSYFPPK